MFFTLKTMCKTQMFRNESEMVKYKTKLFSKRKKQETRKNLVDLNQEKLLVTLNINGLVTLKGRDYQNESKGRAQSHNG